MKRTVGAKVDRAIGDGAALVIVDPQWKVVPIDQRNWSCPHCQTRSYTVHSNLARSPTIISVLAVHSERELGKSGGRNTLK